MSFTFQQPKTSPTTTVVVRNPNFGDIRRIDNNVVHHESRSGELLSVKDDDWPDEEFNVYQFSLLQEDETIINNLKNFFANFSAQEIGIIDHLGDTWHGYIISPVIDYITEKDNCLSVNFTVEFMGVKQP